MSRSRSHSRTTNSHYEDHPTIHERKQNSASATELTELHTGFNTQFISQSSDLDAQLAKLQRIDEASPEYQGLIANAEKKFKSNVDDDDATLNKRKKLWIKSKIYIHNQRLAREKNKLAEQLDFTLLANLIDAAKKPIPAEKNNIKYTFRTLIALGLFFNFLTGIPYLEDTKKALKSGEVPIPQSGFLNTLFVQDGKWFAFISNSALNMIVCYNTLYKMMYQQLAEQQLTNSQYQTAGNITRVQIFYLMLSALFTLPFLGLANADDKGEGLEYAFYLAGLIGSIGAVIGYNYGGAVDIVALLKTLPNKGRQTWAAIKKTIHSLCPDDEEIPVLVQGPSDEADEQSTLASVKSSIEKDDSRSEINPDGPTFTSGFQQQSSDDIKAKAQFIQEILPYITEYLTLHPEKEIEELANQYSDTFEDFSNWYVKVTNPINRSSAEKFWGDRKHFGASWVLRTLHCLFVPYILKPFYELAGGVLFGAKGWVFNNTVVKWGFGIIASMPLTYVYLGFLNKITTEKLLYFPEIYSSTNKFIGYATRKLLGQQPSSATEQQSLISTQTVSRSYECNKACATKPAIGISTWGLVALLGLLVMCGAYGSSGTVILLGLNAGANRILTTVVSIYAACLINTAATSGAVLDFLTGPSKDQKRLLEKLGIYAGMVERENTGVFFDDDADESNQLEHGQSEQGQPAEEGSSFGY